MANGTLKTRRCWGQRLTRSWNRGRMLDFKFDVDFFGQLDALVMVVDFDSKLLLRFILTDDVLIQESFDLGRLGKVDVFGRRFVVLIFVDDVLTNADAFVTDEDGRPRDQLPNVILALVAK